MDLLMLPVVAIMTAVIVALLLLVFRLRGKLSELQFAKSSQSVRYGKLSEQWIPLAKYFPYNSANFRFLGSPIDGIAFEDDGIILCEFKAAGSRLSDKQKRIRELVEKKKVKWLEFKVNR